MKHRRSFIWLLIAYLGLVACSSRAQNATSQNRDEGTVLIVYLSRTGNTEAVAELIQQRVGGTLVALALETPYPKAYDTMVEQVAEENETGFLPPLKTEIDIEKYDTIFLGFPTWGMQLPPPMKSFLHQYDLSGKTVVPFNTNAGYGVGSSFATVNELCPNATIPEGFSIRGGIERDGILFVMKGDRAEAAEAKVIEWLQEIEMIE